MKFKIEEWTIQIGINKALLNFSLHFTVLQMRLRNRNSAIGPSIKSNVFYANLGNCENTAEGESHCSTNTVRLTLRKSAHRVVSHIPNSHKIVEIVRQAKQAENTKASIFMR